MRAEVEKIVADASNPEVAGTVISAFIEIEEAFFLGRWKAAGLDAGHFVEAVRRFLELKLLGATADIGKPLSPMNEVWMQKISNCQGDEGLRLHIPRALLCIYGIRNKRGIGHISRISANRMDATYILASCKWILSEIVRASSNLGIAESSEIVSRLSERYIEGFWKNGATERILIPGLSLKQQILFYCLNKIDCDVASIVRVTEKDSGYVRRLLKTLHAERFLEFDQESSVVVLTPLGVKQAEQIALENRM